MTKIQPPHHYSSINHDNHLWSIMVPSVVLGHGKSWMKGLPTLGCLLLCVSFSQVLLLQCGTIHSKIFMNPQLQKAFWSLTIWLESIWFLLHEGGICITKKNPHFIGPDWLIHSMNFILWLLEMPTQRSLCMYIWVSFCRAGKMAVWCPFFFKSRASVWPNLMR